MSKQVLVDLTQFVRQPAASGIQRVLKDLLESLRTVRGLDFRVGYQYRDVMAYVDLDTAADAVGEVFQSWAGLPDLGLRVWNRFELAKTHETAVADALFLFDGYFLPEPSYLPEVLGLAAAAMASLPTAVLAYDTLPATSPHAFRGQHQTTTDAYFRLLARSECTAAISQATLDVLESRLRRRPVPVSAVLPPPVPRRTRQAGVHPYSRPTFVHVGTVEPRKRVGDLLTAVQALWAEGADVGLHVLGAAGWESPEVLQRLREADSGDAHLRWDDAADDRAVNHAMAAAHAVIYISRDEGYGLPPLEALAAGSPVVVMDDLPSLDGLTDQGQVRLHEPSAEALTGALRSTLDTEAYEELRRGATSISLPSKETFARALEDWLLRAMD